MIRKLLSLFVALMIALFPILAEGKSYYSSYGRSSNNSRSTYKSVFGNFSHGSKTYGSQRSIPHPKSTFKAGGTKYKYNDTYKNSGLPKVKRSESAKKEFLKSKGYKRVPQGYEVDHIVPLSKGGRDEPFNMQLIPKSMHKQKTAGERKR